MAGAGLARQEAIILHSAILDLFDNGLCQRIGNIRFWHTRHNANPKPDQMHFIITAENLGFTAMIGNNSATALAGMFGGGVTGT